MKCPKYICTCKYIISRTDNTYKCLPSYPDLSSLLKTYFAIVAMHMILHIHNAYNNRVQTYRYIHVCNYLSSQQSGKSFKINLACGYACITYASGIIIIKVVMERM